MPLTGRAATPNMHGMAHSFLIFDFEGNEQAAQQARHRLEGWKQGFRLDKKLQLKFERKDSESEPVPAAATPAKGAKSESKAKSKPRGKSKAGEEDAEKETEAGTAGKIRLIVRLDFSDHEKLSHQRWIERIPGEEPFKNAHPKIVRAGSPEFAATSDLFDSLD